MDYLRLWDSGNHLGISCLFFFLFSILVTLQIQLLRLRAFEIITDAQMDGLDRQVYLHAPFPTTFNMFLHVNPTKSSASRPFTLLFSFQREDRVRKE